MIGKVYNMPHNSPTSFQFHTLKYLFFQTNYSHFTHYPTRSVNDCTTMFPRKAQMRFLPSGKYWLPPPIPRNIRSRNWFPAKVSSRGRIGLPVRTRRHHTHLPCIPSCSPSTPDLLLFRLHSCPIRYYHQTHFQGKQSECSNR